MRKGDVVNVAVQAYYESPESLSTLPAQSLLPTIASAFASTVMVDGQVVQSAMEAAAGALGVGTVLRTDNNYLPHAYLNYIIFDKNFVPIDEGLKRVSTAALKAHETLAVEITPDYDGYIFIYVSNESQWDVNVFFDELTVTHEHLDIVQHDDFYPFGLTFNQNRDRQLKNKYLYNGKELQDELGLDWYHYGSRYYDPALGRWHVIDPAASKYSSLSPYSYALNNPIIFLDPDGEDPIDFLSGLANSLVSNHTPTGAGRGIGAPAAGSVARSDYNAGQRVGDYLSYVAGVAETLIGGTGAAAGVVAAPATSGVSLVLTAEGAAIATEGLIVISNATKNIANGDNSQLNAEGSSAGSYAPDEPLSRKSGGEPKPDPEATGPHTQLGKKQGRNGEYTQAREFDGDGNPVRDIDFTDHGRPQNHPNPHQHEYKPNSTGGTPQRSKEIKPLEE